MAKKEELIDKFLKEYGEKGTALTFKNKFWQEVEASLLGTEIKLSAIRKVKNDDRSNEYHYVVNVHGGNNGHSDWPRYLLMLTAFILKLKNIGYRAWLIQLTNDCADDVFDVYIGIDYE